AGIGGGSRVLGVRTCVDRCAGSVWRRACEGLVGRAGGGARLRQPAKWRGRARIGDSEALRASLWTRSGGDGSVR
ncbi:hypothetical protein M885DRAFT_526752, partial [Pelagophyceae sp. CCMP2097]